MQSDSQTKENTGSCKGYPVVFEGQANVMVIAAQEAVVGCLC